MGLGCSTLRELDTNENLKRFCGNEPVGPNDFIWNKLVSHSLPPVFSREDSFMLDTCVESLRNELMINNLTTGNFPSLVKVFVIRAKELQSSVQTSDSMFIWQAYNGLFIIRNCIKYFAEYCTEEVFVRQFTADPAVSPLRMPVNGEGSNSVTSSGHSNADHMGIMESLVETLLQIITDLPVKSFTYLLHLEAVNTLLVLLSTQMFSERQAIHLHPFKILFEEDDPQKAALLVKALLCNYIHQRVPPYSAWQGQDTGSLVLGVASGIWNIVKKGVGLEKAKDPLDSLKQYNLAAHSLYLLLILVNHCTARNEHGPLNHYREALMSFVNDNNEDALPEMTAAFRLSYSSLYETICNEMKSDDTTLLLYMLIHRNSSFRSYVMARSDIEQLVLPILFTLYNAPTSTSHHIYMSLIVLLILSEDELFNQQVHDIVLKNVSWYTERTVTEISLGGLMILVVIRTIHYNILKMRDKYLHTNCLAALANMSSKFRALHPYVAQRLVSVFETLAKRHSKLLESLNAGSPVETTKQESEKSAEIVQDINVLEEVIRMVLEILNSVLTHQLPQNRHLVYTLLYKRAVFDMFRSYNATQDLVANIDLVINYFNERLGLDNHDLSSSEVMKIVEDSVLQWKPDLLNKFPDLKFRYVEEDQPEEFFIPYIWSLVYHNSGINWSSMNVTLFSPETEFVLSTSV